jgi:hypothetical protein
VLHLGSRARVVFAATWLAGQSALILSASTRPDNIFGFRMFPEASTMEIHLSREIAAGDAPAPRGEWTARDRLGQMRPWSWSDRVRDGVIGRVDVRVFASYGVGAQLYHLQRALDDVADHIGDDTQTKRLVAKVDYWKNGGDRCTVTLYSHARAVL